DGFDTSVCGLSFSSCADEETDSVVCSLLSSTSSTSVSSPFDVLPSVSIFKIGVPTLTVSPLSTRISFTTPSNKDGTSAVTLSVSTSHNGSYSETVSPTCTSHSSIVPS